MSRFTTPRFAVLAAVVALLALGASAWLAPDPLALRWALVGWAATASVGWAGGLWLSQRYGRPGSGFVVALGTCMLLRFALALAGVVAVRLWQPEGLVPLLGGLIAGYLPLQAFESVWFWRRARAERRGTPDTEGSRLPSQRALPGGPAPKGIG